MRRLVGPIVLAVLALISLLFLQHRSPETTSPTGATGTTPPAPAEARRGSPPAADAVTGSTSAPETPPTHPSVATGPLAPVAPGDEDSGAVLPPSAAATPRTAAQAALWSTATTKAVTFMTAFARPRTPGATQTWWLEVKPFLSAQAAADYAGTDPTAVPFNTVTGPAVVVPVDAPDSLVIAVRVPTDAGPYLVEIETTDTGQRVSRATPSDQP